MTPHTKLLLASHMRQRIHLHRELCLELERQMRADVEEQSRITAAVARIERMIEWHKDQAKAICNEALSKETTP